MDGLLNKRIIIELIIMTFQEKVKKHLCEYKNKKFHYTGNGVWKHNGKETPLKYAFKAPLKGEKHPDADLNLISSYKDKFLQYEKNLKNKIKRHIYFHHMNSSQAMCFNFFYPLFAEKKLELITNFLGYTNETIDYTSTCFEKESEVEGNERRSTNFDFYFKTLSGKKIYLEIKYTENEFGKVQPDEDHKEKYTNIYSHHLDSVADKYKSQQKFLENYQIMRNIININKNSYVVFIYPAANEKIKYQAELAKREMLLETFKEHLKLVEWEQLFETARNQITKPELMSQFEEFGEKYLPKSIF